MAKRLKNIKDKAIKRVKNHSSKAGLGGSKTKRGGQYIVALDIGTENVKALIGRIVDNEIEIVGVGRAKQGLQDMQAGAISDIAAVTANCNKALARAEKQAGISARAVVIGIAGELVKGRTMTVRVQRKDPKKTLEIEEVEKIIGLVQKRAFDRAKDQIADELGGKDVDIKLVNSALVHMEIDGYPVTNPVGFQGKEVLVQLYTAFAPMIHIGALEQVASKLDMDLLAVAAEPFAVARSIVGDTDDSSLSAILMDVGGGTTDIAVLNEGGVQGTQMFGIGGRAFTKSIVRDLEINFSQAERLKLSIDNDEIPEKLHSKVEDSLSKTVKVWRSGIELALSEYSNLEHLPHDILLCGGGASLQMLIDELEGSSWYRELPFARKPSVKYISPDEVVGIHDTTETLDDHTFVTAMGLLRVGMDTVSQGEESLDDASIQSKINRILRI